MEQLNILKHCSKILDPPTYWLKISGAYDILQLTARDFKSVSWWIEYFYYRISMGHNAVATVCPFPLLSFEPTGLW